MKMNLLISFLSAILLTAGLYPFNLYPLSWFGFLPLYLLCLNRAQSTKTLLFTASLTGLIYYGYFLSWLISFKIAFYFLMVFCALPLFPLHFGFLKLLSRKIGPSPPLIPLSAISWILLHQIYIITPLGGVHVEIPFLGPLWFLQLVAFGGFSLPFLILIGLNVSLALGLTRKSWLFTTSFLLFAILLGGSYLWGQHSLLSIPPRPKIKLALIQHNLPMSDSWRLDHKEELYATYKSLAFEAAQKKPAMIIFPLYSLPEDLLRNPAFFSSLARSLKTPILAASHIPKIPGGSLLQDGYMNVAVLFDAEGRIISNYQGVQLPPHLPGESRGWTKERYEVLQTPLGKAGVLLCYEDTNPKLAREAARQGATFLIALSNPGHFLKTFLPDYHLLQDQLRAVESHLPVARVCANGYTAMIDQKGRIISKSTLGRQEIVLAEIETPSSSV